MTNQVIPAQAIEAAARAAYDQVRPLMGFPSDFEEAPEPIQETYRGITRAALEAAAPHLLARGWDEGREEGYEAGRDRGAEEKHNPYRATK